MRSLHFLCPDNCSTMGSLSPAISSKLLLPTTTSDRTSFHALIRSSFPCRGERPNMIGVFKRTHCVASAEKKSKSAIDFSDPEWKTKFEEDFEKRFNIPHMRDFFPDAVSYPSTFCLRMRYLKVNCVCTIFIYIRLVHCSLNSNNSYLVPFLLLH